MLFSANATAMVPMKMRMMSRGTRLNTRMPITQPMASPVSRIGMLRRS